MCLRCKEELLAGVAKAKERFLSASRADLGGRGRRRDDPERDNGGSYDSPSDMYDAGRVPSDGLDSSDRRKTSTRRLSRGDRHHINNSYVFYSAPMKRRSSPGRPMPGSRHVKRLPPGDYSQSHASASDRSVKKAYDRYARATQGARVFGEDVARHAAAGGVDRGGDPLTRATKVARFARIAELR